MTTAQMRSAACTNGIDMNHATDLSEDDAEIANVIAMTGTPMTIPSSDIQLFDERDLAWIDDLLDLVERSIDQPWRVLLERIEHAPLAIGRRPISSRARQQIVAALRRVIGGRAAHGRIARKLRAEVLGHPALDRDERDARISIAAVRLGIEPHDVETLLWADLARERPVTLPGGRPDRRLLAAFANVDRLQREMRRAREIELRVYENAGALVRMAARCGLLTQVTREPDGALVLRIAGPLSLFHATTVYGRALGALVPFLAEHARFDLAIQCEFASGPHILRVAPPVLLPSQPPRMKPSLAERLAQDLERLQRADIEHVEREPAPIVVDEHVLFPDLAVEIGGVRWHVELVGFSTTEYLAAKLARYAAANVHVILCVDATRSKLTEAHPCVLAYQRRISVDALVEIVEQIVEQNR